MRHGRLELGDVELVLPAADDDGGDAVADDPIIILISEMKPSPSGLSAAPVFGTSDRSRCRRR
jgi:hypothetical protein